MDGLKSVGLAHGDVEIAVAAAAVAAASRHRRLFLLVVSDLS